MYVKSNRPITAAAALVSALLVAGTAFAAADHTMHH